MKDYFSSQNKTFSKLEDLGVLLGASPDNINPMNALRTVTKAVNELTALEERAQAMGYSSAANALKALRMITTKTPTTDLSRLPDVFHQVPYIWLKGIPKSRYGESGAAPMGVQHAKRKHQLILPLLQEAWDRSEGQDEIRDDLTKVYLTKSATEFETRLFAYVNDLDDIPSVYELDEEYVDTHPEPTISELMKAVRAGVCSEDYGVGGHMPEVSWDDEDSVTK